MLSAVAFMAILTTTTGNGLSDFVRTQLEGNASEALIKDRCMIKLIKETIEESGNIYVYITDDRQHEELVRSLQHNFVHSYYNRPNALQKLKFISLYNLQILQEKSRFQEVIQQIQPLQSSKFVILVRNREEIADKFKVLWNHRLVNAVGCYIADGFVNCYTYFPYSRSNCNQAGALHLVRKCDIRNGVFSSTGRLYPEKAEDLHKCHINITFTQNVPSSYYTASNKLTGWEIELLNEIIERMNGVPVYNILPPKATAYRTSTGYRRLVENSEIGGGLAVSLKGLIHTDFCMYGRTLCTAWVVPMRKDTPRSADFLVKVFPPSVWILLAAVYLTMACTIKVFNRSAKCCNIFFKMVPYLLSNTTRTRRISRKLQSLWLCFCLLMNSIYQSGYQSTLLVPNSTKQITTTREVIDSNLKIFGIPDVIADAMSFFRFRSKITGRRLRMIKRRLTYEEWVYRMTVRKDSAFLGFRETVHYHVDGTELAGKIHIPDHCIINYFLAFVLKKNSHLTESLVKYASRLGENGFLEYFIRKHLKRRSERNIPKRILATFKPLKIHVGNDYPPPIDFDKLFVVFVLHLSGNTLAFVVFVVEKKSRWDWEKVKRHILRALQSAWGYKD